MELYLFSNLLADKSLGSLLRFKDARDRAAYFEAFAGLRAFAFSQSMTGWPVREYLVTCLMETPGLGEMLEDGWAVPYLERDVEALFQNFFATDWAGLCAQEGVLPLPSGGPRVAERFSAVYRQAVAGLVESDSPRALCLGLCDFFALHRDGMEARYAAFQWKDGGLSGVDCLDSMTFDRLGGLEYQKKILLDNTAAFLRGIPANDVLLVGSSGAGKSSSVKATLNHFAGQGLRLVELLKQDVSDLPRLMELLRHKKHRYILFIDDLSFEKADAGYMELKVALDGRLTTRPDNVLVYATSNRRHLIRETWKERDSDEDIHQNDTLHEKMSLSERFGIRLYFPVLSQAEYFDIIELLLGCRGIDFTEEIGREAAAWATAYNGRSGRTAKQFAAHFQGRNS